MIISIFPFPRVVSYITVTWSLVARPLYFSFPAYNKFNRKTPVKFGIEIKLQIGFAERTV